MAIALAQTDSEIEACFPIMVQLRPLLQAEQFVSLVRRQFAEGYQLAFVHRNSKVAGAAGFRYQTNLVWGRFLYVDDLITDSELRGQGVGDELFQWLVKQAQSNGCKRLELDSGFDRLAAHRFYLNHSMNLGCHHFSMKLTQ